MFHNTIGLQDKKLRKYRRQSDSQETVVLTAIKVSKKKWTPSEIWKELLRIGTIAKKTPLTSIRRAMSNLAYDDELVKLPVQKIGIYGLPEHYWSDPVTGKKILREYEREQKKKAKENKFPRRRAARY